MSRRSNKESKKGTFELTGWAVYFQIIGSVMCDPTWAQGTCTSASAQPVRSCSSQKHSVPVTTFQSLGIFVSSVLVKSMASRLVSTEGSCCQITLVWPQMPRWRHLDSSFSNPSGWCSQAASQQRSDATLDCSFRCLSQTSQKKMKRQACVYGSIPVPVVLIW